MFVIRTFGITYSASCSLRTFLWCIVKLWWIYAREKCIYINLKYLYFDEHKMFKMIYECLVKIISRSLMYYRFEAYNVIFFASINFYPDKYCSASSLLHCLFKKPLQDLQFGKQIVIAYTYFVQFIVHHIQDCQILLLFRF